MSTEQTDLPRISDAAARHTVDAAKAFKEFRRVREAIKAFEGSMHWKKVEHYEYLVHKQKGGKLVYLGTRDSETEAKLNDFSTQKRKLESRLRTLKETVETSQRINKAVRAGSVPPPVVDVLVALDDAGLGDHSLVVGSPALYAYAQRSGLRVDAIKAPGDRASVAEERQHHLLVLIDATVSHPDKLDKLCDAVKTADITPLSWPSSQKVALDVSYGKREKRQTDEHEWSHVMCSRPKSEPCHTAWFSHSDHHHAPPTVLKEEVMELLDNAPKFEQVVIGRTGRMAMMRTLDPLLFVSLCEHQREVERTAPGEANRRKLQVELVTRMLEDYLVTSEIQDQAHPVGLDELHRLLGTTQQNVTCVSPWNSTTPARKS